MVNSARPAVQVHLLMRCLLDPHRAWVAEYSAIHDRLYDPGTTDFGMDHPDWLRLRELDKLICTTPATTPEGAAIQSEFALSDEANMDLTGGIAGDLDNHVLRNVLATLKSLT